MHSATRLSRKYGNTSAVKPHTFSGEPKNTEVSHVKLQFQPLATGSFLEGEEAGGGQKRILFIQVSPWRARNNIILEHAKLEYIDNESIANNIIADDNIPKLFLQESYN